MKEIREYEAILVLMQMYQGQLSMWISMSVAVGIGLLAIPLFVLNASLNPTQVLGLKERVLCFILTLALATSAVYLINKTIYLGAMLRQALIRVEVTDKGNSLMQYRDKEGVTQSISNI